VVLFVTARGEHWRFGILLAKLAQHFDPGRHIP
jgi:hypothetical protein